MWPQIIYTFDNLIKFIWCFFTPFKCSQHTTLSPTRIYLHLSIFGEECSGFSRELASNIVPLEMPEGRDEWLVSLTVFRALGVPKCSKYKSSVSDSSLTCSTDWLDKVASSPYTLSLESSKSFLRIPHNYLLWAPLTPNANAFIWFLGIFASLYCSFCTLMIREMQFDLLPNIHALYLL